MLRGGWLKLGLWAALLWLCLGSAQAASYSYRSDSFAWETAANTINTWDGGSCTGYPGDDDRVTINLTGGFVFRFAGVNYSSVRVLSNGMLQFGADTGFFRNYTNTTLPAGAATARSGCTASATDRVIMAYWTDLDPSRAGSGKVSWEQKGTAPNRRLVVSWNSVYQYNTSTPYTFQIILYEGGEFKFQYGNANATGSQATIGVQVSNSDYTLYSFNSGYNANGSAIRWFVPSGLPERVAEYRFDEFVYTGQVGEVRDASAQEQHGVAVGDAVTDPGGKVCRALDVDRNTDATRRGVDSLLNLPSGVGNSGTLSFWYRAAVSWNSSQAAMLMDASGQTDQPFYLQRDSGGVLRLRLTDSAGATLSASTSAQNFPANQWVHVAATWKLASGSNQSTLRLYVNGSLTGTGVGTTSGSLASSLGSLFVGDNRLSAAPAGGTDDSANGRIDELRVYNFDLGPVEIAADMVQTHDCTPPLHHLEIRHASGNGITCTPSSFEVRACTDASCSVPYTAGVSGSLGASNASWLWPAGAGFTIPAGSSFVTVQGQLPVVGSATLGVASSSPAATNALRCNFGSPECSFTAAAAGFLVSLSNHRAEASTTLGIAAVRQSDNSLACTPAFASVSKSLTLACGYVNPATGTLPVRVAGQALNASGSSAAACGSRALSVAFDATGSASLTLQYADVGRFSVTATYTGSAASGDAGLSMTGSAQAVAAPKDFLFSNLPSGAQVAGAAFGLRLTARNTADAATPNFGQEGETVALTHTKLTPVFAGAQAGAFSHGALSFTAGVANPADLIWTEVGTINLAAALSDNDYLGSGLAVTGSTAAAIGPFRPARFKVSGSPACGSFSYAGLAGSSDLPGQALPGVTVEAVNALGARTLNYDGSQGNANDYAQAVVFSEAVASGKGSFDPTGAPASRFALGITPELALSYRLSSKLTAPFSTSLRVTDALGVSSSGGAEPSFALRSGRLLLQSAIGSSRNALALPLRLEYWSGKSWVLGSDDSCTGPALAGKLTAVAQSNRVGLNGAAAGWTTAVQSLSLASGIGSLTLGAPSGGGAGTLDVALNLGSTTTDRACLPNHPATTGAGLPWLRARQGTLNGCADAGNPLGRWDSDPSARASFGSVTAESQKRLHERQVY
ncbi:DUF6701 domain-containing protein [Inhella sp.]|uniref:DUF6701 domain-containing protein n=1 Tax=Inhella sp. TaxID=1921806 RepID=UPI0035B2E524